MDGGGVVYASGSLSKQMIINKPQQVEPIDAKEQEPEPNVLAVDYNLIDGKIVEKLLKNSSCKGTFLNDISNYLPKEVPVVIMSSENIPPRIHKCLEEGAQMFMLKPLRQSDVTKLRGQFMKFGS